MSFFGFRMSINLFDTKTKMENFFDICYCLRMCLNDVKSFKQLVEFWPVFTYIPSIDTTLHSLQECDSTLMKMPAIKCGLSSLDHTIAHLSFSIRRMHTRIYLS